MGLIIAKVSKIFTKKVESETTLPTATEGNKDERRRNSLAYNISRFVQWEDDDYAPLITEIDDALHGKQTGKKKLRINKATKIADAIVQGDLRVLRNEVIVNFSTINKQYNDMHRDYTLLHITAEMGYYTMLEFIINPRNHSEFDDTVLAINCRNDKNRTPLMLCFQPPTASFLGLKFGIDENGNYKTEKPEDLEIESDWIQPGGPKQRERCIQLLLKSGADVNDPDFHLFRPIHYATMWGWTSVVNLLLEHRADVNAITVTGKTVLHYAVEYGNDDIVDLICRRNDVMLDIQDSEGYTPLILAIERGDDVGNKMAGYLLKAGAEPDVTNHRRKSPLLIACAKQNLDQIYLLFDHNVTRRKSAINLLQGEIFEVVTKRIEDDIRKEQELAEQKAREAAEELEKQMAQAMTYKKVNIASAMNAWIPYIDKRGRGTFYYNKVTRKSQFEVPHDYVPNKEYAAKDATFGMSFYH
jgi:ankyrin repeat protein